MTKPTPDIVKRLRLIKGRWLGLKWWRPVILEAADEIVRLRAAVKQRNEDNLEYVSELVELKGKPHDKERSGN